MIRSRGGDWWGGGYRGTAAFLMYAIATCINFLQTIMARPSQGRHKHKQPGRNQEYSPSPYLPACPFNICRFSLNSWCDFRGAFRLPAKTQTVITIFIPSRPSRDLCHSENILYELRRVLCAIAGGPRKKLMESREKYILKYCGKFKIERAEGAQKNWNWNRYIFGNIWSNLSLNELKFLLLCSL